MIAQQRAFSHNCSAALAASTIGSGRRGVVPAVGGCRWTQEYVVFFVVFGNCVFLATLPTLSPAHVQQGI